MVPSRGQVPGNSYLTFIFKTQPFIKGSFAATTSLMVADDIALKPSGFK